MASFNTHITVGILASGIIASGALIAGLTRPGETFVYASLGALGSILPDLDADNSIPTRIGTGLLSLTISFATVFLLAKNLPFLYLPLIWVGTFLMLRFVLFPLMTKFTKHRGLFHSIPTGILLGLITTVIASRLLKQIPQRAWLAGIFVGGGYMIHLILDELYSIDWAGQRVRRSFGSAFKLWSTTNWIGTIVLYLACILMYFISPSPRPLLNAFATAKNRIYLPQHFPFVRLFTTSQVNGQN